MIKILKNVSRVGIKMSGGVDSSLLAFVLVKTIMDNNLNVSLTPIVIVEEASPFQEIFAKQVIDKIEHETSFKFNKMQVYSCLIGENKILKMRAVENSLVGQVDIIVSGTTQYPKDPAFVEPGGPDDNRRGVFPELWDNWIYTPFINLDKRDVAGLYKTYDLLDTLFPLTRSCVSYTTDFTKTCGECWWCKEREWAFGIR